MPVVLSQHPFNERYRDVEGVIYNFPPQYYSEIKPFDRFLYYRPSKGAVRSEASCYIAHGMLGNIYPTPDAQDLRTAEIASVRYFKNPVSFRDPDGRLFESRYESPSAFQGNAVRRIHELDFLRILASANVSEVELSSLVPVEFVALQLANSRRKSRLRMITNLPEGTGYVPSGRERPDPTETAALQERARGDHQLALNTIIARTSALGGVCSMNNNIDLLSDFGERKVLFEAKSLLDARLAVDRMRYAIGQLADYQKRYEGEIGLVSTAVAFASSLGRDEAFVGDVLDSKKIALLLVEHGEVRAKNVTAGSLEMFA